MEQIVDTPVFLKEVSRFSSFALVQLEFLKNTLMSLVYGFFRTLSREKNSARAAASPSAELPQEVSSWTPAAFGGDHRFRRVGADTRGRQDPLLEPTLQRDILEPS